MVHRKLSVTIVQVLCLVFASNAETVAKNSATLREVTSQSPSAMKFSYEFPGPLRSADIELRYSGSKHSLEGGKISFGNGKKIELPSSLMKCLPDPHPEFLDFLFLAVDDSYPKDTDYWWSSIVLPFGEKLQSPSSDSKKASDIISLHVYPYIEFEFSNWALSRIDIHRSSTETRVVSLPMQRCPDDIAWAIKKDQSQ